MTRLQADYIDDKETGRNEEKGSFEVTKLRKWEKRREISNECPNQNVKN